MTSTLTQSPSSETANRPIEVPQSGYVSSHACRECHTDEHASWHASYHRTMTQVASPENVLGRFDGSEFTFYGWTFRPERKGDEFWLNIRNSSGKQSFNHKLVMSTGSHHMQKYWYPTGRGRALGLSPLVYHIESGRWLPEHTAFLRPTEAGLPFREGDWNQNCNQCHATGSQPRLRAETFDTKVAEFGISCEACHGPGEEHVRAKTSETIVNPRKLRPERSAQVCGQCHGAWVLEQKASQSWADTGHVYRPGNDLHKTRQYVHGGNVEQLREHIKAKDSFWSDGEIRVAGREYNALLSTPCFANATDEGRKMSCISCHAMHATTHDVETAAKWADDQLGPGMEFNAACYQCHPTYRDNLSAHTKHKASSSGSLCYNCHMPHTSYGLLKAVRTHTISSPSAASTIETGRPNACNQCHLDRTLQWTASQLTSMYGQPPVELPHEHHVVAASVLATLKGDAAQRALTAWTMGWEETHIASGTDWIVFYLMDLMFDEYDAIRYIAHRSLTHIPGFESVKFDHMRPEDERDRVMDEVFARWQKLVTSRPTQSQLLFDENGSVRMGDFQFLRRQRDNRKVVITE